MSKQDIILLHGALGSKKQFEELQQELKRDFNVFTFNFNGHGDEPTPEKSFTIEMFTYDLANFCILQNIHSADIFGYSMGGYVALNYAVKFPEKVNKIFTLATKFDWNIHSAVKEAGMLNPEIIYHKAPAFAKSLIKMHGENKWKTLLNKTAEMMLNLGTKPVLKDEDFMKIVAKCKLCVGDKDKMVSIEETEWVHNNIKNSVLHIYKDIEHPIEKIDVKLLAADISSFFKLK